MRSDYDVFATVVLEAALFFSLPTWILTANSAWPANNPDRFGIALLIGASLALFLCHVVPAICGPPVLAVLDCRVPWVIEIAFSLWSSVGAAVSLVQIARTSGRLFSGWRNEGGWQEIAIVAAIVCIFGSVWMTWQGRYFGRTITGLCLIVGVSLVFAAVWKNWAGLVATNRHLISEDLLGDPISVAQGMVIAATPASALALRLGRLRLTTKQIWLTGVMGVWLPLVLSVGACSVAKMCGARLFWRPSLPVDTSFAFVWLTKTTINPANSLWPLSLSVVGPCMVYAIWIRDLTTELSWKWQKPFTLFCLAISAYWLMSPEPWSLYYPFWYMSTLVALGILASLWLLFKLRYLSQGGPGVISSA